MDLLDKTGMIWSSSSSTTTTSQLILIGTAAFCISFGLIYSLIYCYKSRRKNLSDENERLRDELLRQKFLTRRRSTSLTSPPQSHSVINPNYNASPYKTPTRHLRSTSASYSPTHYLSPHHRRSSTPTRPWCQKGCESTSGTPSKSVCNHQQMQSGSKTCINSNYNSHHHHLHGCYNIGMNCNNTSTGSSGNLNILINNPPATMSKIYPQVQKHPCGSKSTATPISIPIPSKLSNSWDNHNYDHHQKNQKFFSFGPIPPARKSMGVLPARNSNFENENEKQPLLKMSKSSIAGKTKMEKFVLDDTICEEESDSKQSNFLKRKNYTPDLFKKEYVVEEIPYYTEQMSCN